MWFKMNVVTSALEACRIRARNTNINDLTLLATDYLNHFNEALMLAEMVRDMPDMREDFMCWQPCSYPDHFRQSGIADRELAIEAYPHAPPEYRIPFETTIQKLDDEILKLQQHFRLTAEAEMSASSDMEITEQCRIIRSLIDRASTIINGYSSHAPRALPREVEKTPLDQEAINALFG